MEEEGSGTQLLETNFSATAEEHGDVDLGSRGRPVFALGSCEDVSSNSGGESSGQLPSNEISFDQLPSNEVADVDVTTVLLEEEEEEKEEEEGDGEGEGEEGDRVELVRGGRGEDRGRASHRRRSSVLVAFLSRRASFSPSYLKLSRRRRSWMVGGGREAMEEAEGVVPTGSVSEVEQTSGGGGGVEGGGGGWRERVRASGRSIVSMLKDFKHLLRYIHISQLYLRNWSQSFNRY